MGEMKRSAAICGHRTRCHNRASMFRPLSFIICLAVLCGCNDSAPQQSAPATPAVDPATASSLSGHVTFTGAVPPAEVIRLDGDPKCVAAAQGEERQTEFIVSND